MPAILSSQQQPAQPGHAVVTGVAVDSVRGGYLRGAIVSVSGTALSAITDSSGRFRIDSVPPGTRYLEVMHPLLDSIALKVRSPQREMKASDTTSFILSVP
ncbi:MAG TPA: carboxypeptidase regulatory-like domain-containing protein, partial [Gemmatimonadaceae bacterium]|nr:carboxypeptidase regulatory-like domain-containing protein [Gemmatimonadaceae bacterium]